MWETATDTYTRAYMYQRVSTQQQQQQQLQRQRATILHLINVIVPAYAGGFNELHARSRLT